MKLCQREVAVLADADLLTFEGPTLLLDDAENPRNQLLHQADRDARGAFHVDVSGTRMSVAQVLDLPADRAGEINTCRCVTTLFDDDTWRQLAWVNRMHGRIDRCSAPTRNTSGDLWATETTVGAEDYGGLRKDAASGAQFTPSHLASVEAMRLGTVKALMVAADTYAAEQSAVEGRTKRLYSAALDWSRKGAVEKLEFMMRIYGTELSRHQWPNSAPTPVASGGYPALAADLRPWVEPHVWVETELRNGNHWEQFQFPVQFDPHACGVRHNRVALKVPTLLLVGGAVFAPSEVIVPDAGYTTEEVVRAARHITGSRRPQRTADYIAALRATTC